MVPAHETSQVEGLHNSVEGVKSKTIDKIQKVQRKVIKKVPIFAINDSHKSHLLVNFHYLHQAMKSFFFNICNNSHNIQATIISAF